VIAGDDAHVFRRQAQSLFEEIARSFELRLERQVGQVTSYDDVIDLGDRDLLRDRLDITFAMNVLSLQTQIRITRQSLVQKAMRRNARQREHV